MPATSARPAIPIYELYGEPGALPDILHCESIFARAALHDWVIRPHRHARLHQFLLVKSGGGEAGMDGRTLSLEPDMFLNLPPGVVHAFRFEAGTRGWVVTAPPEAIDAGPAAALRAAIAAPGAAVAEPAMAATFDQIAAEHAADRPGRAAMLTAAVALLCGHAARALTQEPGAPASAAGLRSRFEAMVEARFREHLPISAYAGALGVSPTHLSRVVRAATGVSASRFVEARLMREARRELAYTNLHVRQVAYRLGYEDPAYFTRVFARACGMPPGRYRALAAGAQPASTRPDASE